VDAELLPRVGHYDRTLDNRDRLGKSSRDASRMRPIGAGDRQS